MEILQKIAAFCSNDGYATILAAFIGGIFLILGYLVAHHLKKKETPPPPPETLPPLIPIPPREDPLSGLISNPSEAKDIDQMDIRTEQYIETFAFRCDFVKKHGTVVEVTYFSGKDDDDACANPGRV